jgi:hypothetical protein
MVFGWLFWAFALFILACGTTHLFDIWTLWHPDYGAQGLVKLGTAAASAGTAVAVWAMIPRALALPSPSQYREVSSALDTQVEQRKEVSRVLEASGAAEKVAIFALHRSEHSLLISWAYPTTQTCSPLNLWSIRHSI